MAKHVHVHLYRRSRDESAATKASHQGKLNEQEQAMASQHVAHRENVPKGVYLEPDQEKYPVMVKRNGKYVYDEHLLMAAAREARMHGHEELARRADEIRNREFGGKR